MDNKNQIFITQLGSPKSTKTSDVRSYLREFLSDPRVIDAPRVLWFFILNLFILPFRPKKSALAYQRIEFCGFFPLIEITKSFALKVQNSLKKYEVSANFVLSDKRLKEALKELRPGQKAWIFPQFPQYSGTTVGSIEDIITDSGKEDQVVLIPSFHRLKAFIDLSVQQIEEHLEKYPAQELVISFHGIPVRYVTEKKDIYYKHCFETFYLLRQKLKLPNEKIHMTFQSRLGSEQWLGPYTDEFCISLAKNNITSIGVYCPSFVADCLETTDEIGQELKQELADHDCDLSFIPCLNNSDHWVNGYAEFIEQTVEKGLESSKSLMYDLDNNVIEKEIPKLENKSAPMSPKAKSSIKIVFFTLFLDLIGFSIIFPMFPALAKYYLEVDPNNYFLKLIFGTITSFTDYGGVSMSNIVLFGGFLGALYSLLQFVAAPIWGSLSDKFGRKPVLMISIFGLFISYIMWFFAGSFTLLIAARFIGGIMGGNLGVATAVVADVTDQKNRSKGMAFIGIAFALGFIFGPALGGIMTLINPMDHLNSLISYGVNPFSYAAGLAAILSFANLVVLALKFEETLDKSVTHKNYKSSNLLKLFKPLPYKDVNLTNASYFLFISAFSGMEFTLTFLAVERLAYTSMNNAYMFIFIGLILALVQGGYVRRKANQIGEKKMAMQGLICIIPGLAIIAFMNNSWLLYLGLFFLAVGSAMVIPTLTSLVSLFSPAAEQGRSIGIFRSLGSLGRVIGPIVASIIYWKLGSTIPYLLGAIFMVFPIIVLAKVSNQKEQIL